VIIIQGMNVRETTAPNGAVAVRGLPLIGVGEVVDDKEIGEIVRLAHAASRGLRYFGALIPLNRMARFIIS
jgi:hypothetical protein